MAIYRPRRSPWPLAIALGIAALLLGFFAGYVVFGTRPPDLDAAATAVQAELSRARGLLEVAAIEYRQGAPDGAIVSEPEYAAAQSAVANASEAVDSVMAPIRAVAAERAAALEDGFATLTEQIERLAPPDEVGATTDALIALLEGSGG
jgi:hypothetical protein